MPTWVTVEGADPATSKHPLWPKQCSPLRLKARRTLSQVSRPLGLPGKSEVTPPETVTSPAMQTVPGRPGRLPEPPPPRPPHACLWLKVVAEPYARDWPPSLGIAHVYTRLRADELQLLLLSLLWWVRGGIPAEDREG